MMAVEGAYASVLFHQRTCPEIEEQSEVDTEGS